MTAGPLGLQHRGQADLSGRGRSLRQHQQELRRIIRLQEQTYSTGKAYDYFCDEMENCLPFVFGCTREIRDLAVDAADEKLLLRSTILAAANKMYLDCCFNALRQEENLWDTILPDLA